MTSKEFLDILETCKSKFNFSSMLEELKHGKSYDGIYQELVDKGLTLDYTDNFGGSERSNDYWIVFSVKDKDNQITYFKVPGYYDSYCGGELYVSQLFQVEETEKTVKYWKSI